jgi:hypothetical protein
MTDNNSTAMETAKLTLCETAGKRENRPMWKNDNEETEVFRCLKCGCSRTDARGFLSCILCGAACGLRSEQCYITDDTKTKLLAHAEDLKDFGLTLEEHKSLNKDAKTTIAAIGLGIQIARELQPSGMLRKLILYLRELAISRDEILRLRLTEPEEVDKILNERE